MNNTVIKILKFSLFIAYKSFIFVKASFNPDKTILSERELEANNLINDLTETTPELKKRLEMMLNKSEEGAINNKYQEFFFLLI